MPYLSNYPDGVNDNTFGAPWNDPEVPEKDFEVTCCQTLSRTATVTTNNYIPGASGVDYEPDDEGGCCAVGWHDPDDTSETNWAEEYHDNDHYTPLQLIEMLKKTLEEQLQDLDNIPENKGKARNLRYLIEECSNWSEDETEYLEES